MDDDTRERAAAAAARWAAAPTSSGLHAEVRAFVAASGLGETMTMMGLKPTTQIEAEDLIDPLVRYDVGDLVDAEHYPDGRYWRFPQENGKEGSNCLDSFDIPHDLAAKYIVVEGHRVVRVSDIYRDQEGAMWWATRP